MKTSRTLLIAAGGVIVLALVVQGCDTSVRVYRTTPAPTYYVAEEPAPPAPLAESFPPSPGPDYIWVNGYWDWNGSQYVWVSGYWAVPPTGTTVWIAPRYEGHHYYRGHWGHDGRERHERHDRRR